ncbi:hypothetical protein Acsp03_66770 [Actinomadura sp. NBRC 104412]|nr:hypothetical protein Acsp03_66770 [Actinomadura sp. NBRC 104412]
MTADTYTSLLPEVAHTAAKKTAAYPLQAAGIVADSTRRRAPARRGRLVASHTRAGLVRPGVPRTRSAPLRPRTRARPPRRVCRSPRFRRRNRKHPLLPLPDYLRKD